MSTSFRSVTRTWSHGSGADPGSPRAACAVVVRCPPDGRLNCPSPSPGETDHDGRESRAAGTERDHVHMGEAAPATCRRAPIGDPRIGVLVVAYNASTTLIPTLERLPESFAKVVDHIMVCDDASQDDTYEVGLDF